MDNNTLTAIVIGIFAVVIIAAASHGPASTLPTATPLHQLPSPPRDFTGRAAELEELMNNVGRGGALISGLHGMGGIGKTALALKLAELLTPRYPDAQFFLDLKGTTQPVAPA